MPLNYSKWDALELSDDSDIEEHPNVDKRSFIRMKQRQIHEQRAERKARIEHLRSEGPMNATLLARIDGLLSIANSDGSRGLAKEVSRLKEATQGVVPKAGEQPDPNHQPSVDLMVSNLLAQVFTAVKEKKPAEGEALDQALLKEIQSHRNRLAEREEQRKVELANDEAESKKHITSEDIHDGFDVSHVDKNPSQAIAPTKPKPTATAKGKSKEIEVLNPQSVTSAAPSTAPPAGTAAQDASDSDGDDEEEELPNLTPAALAFSKIKPSDYPSSFAAIQRSPALYTDESTTDALLVEAFEAEMQGNKERAKACVHQGLLLQYCRNLGKDGVALFFKKVGSGDPRAFGVFIDDVQKTYSRIASRCATIKSERAASAAANPDGEETIQLVAQDPSVVITFEVPEGPPPEELQLTGEGSDQLSPEKVREFLQFRWDTFQSFPKNFQKALKTKQLEEVNKVLGRMQVPDAEEVVKKLDEAGIMSFASSDVIDKTGKAPATSAGEAGAGGEAEVSTAKGVQQIDLELD